MKYTIVQGAAESTPGMSQKIFSVFTSGAPQRDVGKPEKPAILYEAAALADIAAKTAGFDANLFYEISKIPGFSTWDG